MTEPEDIERLVGRFGGWLRINSELYGAIFRPVEGFFRLPNESALRQAWRDWQLEGSRPLDAEMTRRQFEEFRFLIASQSELPGEGDINEGSRILPVDRERFFQQSREGKWEFFRGGEKVGTFDSRPKITRQTRHGERFVQYRDRDSGKVIVSRKESLDETESEE